MSPGQSRAVGLCKSPQAPSHRSPWPTAVVFGISTNSPFPLLAGPVDPSFRALSGRLKSAVRRHKSNKYPLSWQGALARARLVAEEQDSEGEKGAMLSRLRSHQEVNLG